MRRFVRLLVACVLCTGISGAVFGQDGRITKFAEEREDGKIVAANGEIFSSWNEYANSLYFEESGLRCAKPPTGEVAEFGDPGDCTFSITNPDPIYDPTVRKYRIPVVVHVIQTTSGQGFISEAMVESQIQILNEDFLAIAGSLGGNGQDVQIEFYLAQTDPGGNPTNGITYTTNNNWFNDNGSYYNTLAWDTNNYLNIYTNTASGALGYVPNLPQGGIVGSNQDRVVILWSSFGLNGPIGPPFNKGRTVTHEVGHYLGLDHTFGGGCGSTSACYSTGDWICDTNRESSPTSGCPGGKATCGSPDPIDNYMDYSDDTCMERFTPEQARRMRCSLEGYRPDLLEVVDQLCGNDDLDVGEECDDGNTLPFDGCSSSCTLELPPAEVSAPGAPPLLFLSKGAISWQNTGAESYSLYRGIAPDWQGGLYGNCQRTDLALPTATYPFNPPAGGMYFFLAAGTNVFGDGTLGSSTAGAERVPATPCH